MLDLAEDRLEGRFVTLAGDTLDSFAFENAEEGGLAVPASGDDGSNASSETSADDPRFVPAPAIAGTLVLAAGIAALAAGGVRGLTPGRGAGR